MSDHSRDRKESELRPYTFGQFHVLADYLDKIRDEGECPRFADVHLIDLYKIAPFIYIFDIIHAIGRWDVRFFGSKLVEAYGQELTGKSVHDIINLNPNSVELTQAMDLMIARKRPLWTINTAESEFRAARGDSKLVKYERLAYPLLGDDDRVDHVIGVLHIYSTLTDEPFETRLLNLDSSTE